MRPEAAPHPAGGPTFDAAIRVLRAAALGRAVDEPDHADRIVPLVAGRFALRPRTVDRAVDAAIGGAAHDLLTRGWRPAEVHAFAAKRLDPLALQYLTDALATTVTWTSGPEWLAELRTLDATVWWSSAAPRIEQWSARHGQGRAATLRVVVDVLALLAYLPRTDVRQPDLPPGVPRHDTVADDRAAARIDALLARATRSDHPAEASSCAAKAQELLLRYAAAPAVRQRVLADPRRLAATVGTEVVGLLQRAAAMFGRQRPVAALPAGSGAERA